MKSQYLVRLSVAIEVVADNREEAIRKARDIAGEVEISEQPGFISAINLDAMDEQG